MAGETTAERLQAVRDAITSLQSGQQAVTIRGVSYQFPDLGDLIDIEKHLMRLLAQERISSGSYKPLYQMGIRPARPS